jgi:hypothetical protein
MPGDRCKRRWPTRVTESDKSTFASGGHKLSICVALSIPYWEMTKALPARSAALCSLLFLLFSRRNSLTDVETRDRIESHVFGLLNIDRSTETRDSRK